MSTTTLKSRSGSLSPSLPQYSKELLEIDPQNCRPWSHHCRDRACLNRQHCAGLIHSIRSYGQMEPVIVRALTAGAEPSFEIISGVRRWFACSQIPDRKLLARVIEAEDRICMILMHADTQGITEFERACSFADHMKSGVFQNQRDLAKTFRVSQSTLSKMIKAAELFERAWFSELFESKLDIPVWQSYRLSTLLKKTDLGSQIETEAKVILAGSPATGKTSIALSLAAMVTVGGLWPDGTSSEPGNVLIWSPKDDLQDTLLPGLLAHGADLKRVYFVCDVFKHNKPRAFDPAEDIPKLYEKVNQLGKVKLIIVDPIVSVMSYKAHKNAEARRMLQSLAALGNQSKAVILGISYFSKGTLSLDPLERVRRSIAFSSLPRVVLVTTKVTDPHGNMRYVLARVKSNYVPDGGGYCYGIEPIEFPDYPGVFSLRVIWGKYAEGECRR